MRKFDVQIRPVFEHVSVARHEPAVMPVDQGQRAEAIELHFVNPLVVIERFGDADERHRSELHRSSLSDADVDGEPATPRLGR